MRRIIRLVQDLAERWKAASVANIPLGKYIIAAASFLHLVWAALLLVSVDTTGSTPVHIICVVAGGRYRAAAWLVAAAAPAFAYPFVRRVGRFSLPFMLIPQQALLLMSAFAGVDAALRGHYADGVQRGWTFILGDQMAIVTLALLYSVAVLEAAWTDERVRV